MANGLKSLHDTKIAHRDLKPENVLMAKDWDGEWQAKLTDFDISRCTRPEGHGTIVTGHKECEVMLALRLCLWVVLRRCIRGW
jgi:serine/threonine protein kinase